MEEGKLNKQNSSEKDDNNIPVERVENSKQQKEEPSESQELNESQLNLYIEKNAELEKLNAELKDSLLRKAAEFENYKRRTENDQLNILKYAAESFIRSILTVYDDLERSLAHIDEAANSDSTAKGLILVYEKFGKILDSQGVKKIDAKGKPFDVHFHEALMQQPADGVPPHTVLDVLEAGYMYKDRVIRHAKVIVSQEMDSPDSKNDSENNNDNSAKLN